MTKGKEAALLDSDTRAEGASPAETCGKSPLSGEAASAKVLAWEQAWYAPEANIKAPIVVRVEVWLPGIE